MRIYVRVTPRSSQQKIEKISEGEYKIWVMAPAQNDLANQAVIKALADYFELPKSSIKIIVGKTARTKLVEIG